MVQSSMRSFGSADALYFVLQRNETGDTGSHQAGEIHVRKPLIGGALPDISGEFEGENGSVPFQLFHAQLGEFGACSYTYWGGRKNPESRLRQFPAAWRENWETGDIIVLVPTAAPTFFILYHLKPTPTDQPEPFLALWQQAATTAYGFFAVPVAKQ